MAHNNTTNQTQVGHIRHDNIDTYVGRDSYGTSHMNNTDVHSDGWLGNPYSVRQYGREMAIRKYAEDFTRRLESDAEFRAAVRSLHGQTLGCYCRSVDQDIPPCHADTIAKYADYLATTEKMTQHKTRNTIDRVQPTSDGTCSLCGVKLRYTITAQYTDDVDGYECESCGRRWLFDEL